WMARISLHGRIHGVPGQAHRNRPRRRAAKPPPWTHATKLRAAALLPPAWHSPRTPPGPHPTRAAARGCTVPARHPPARPAPAPAADASPRSAAGRRRRVLGPVARAEAHIGLPAHFLQEAVVFLFGLAPPDHLAHLVAPVGAGDVGLA